MTNMWILRLLKDSGQEAEWGFWGDSESFEQGTQSGSLAEAAKQFNDDDDVLVLVPGIDVTVLTEAVPAKQRSQVIKVIPYAMEEQVATDVDSLHFALGEKGKDGSFLVAVVSHEKMAEWMGFFKKSGINPTHMLPENLAIPVEQSTWSLIEDGNVFLVRTGDTSAFAIDPDHLDEYLKLEIETTEISKRPKKMKLWNFSQGSKEHLESNFENIEIEESSSQGSMLETYAKGMGEVPFVNLIQQQYQPKENITQVIRYWIPVAVIAVMIFGVQFGYKFYEVNSLSSANDELYDDIRALYKDSFPGDKRLVNPKAQLKSHLEKLKKSGGGNQFLPLFTAASAKLHDNSDVRLLSFRYSESKGNLELELETQDFQRFEAVRQALAEELDVKVRTSNISQNNLVQGSLQVRQK